MFDICALVSLLRSTELYFNTDYPGKYKILKKRCVFWLQPMIVTVRVCAEILKCQVET